MSDTAESPILRHTNFDAVIGSLEPAAPNAEPAPLPAGGLVPLKNADKRLGYFHLFQFNRVLVLGHNE